MGHYRLQNFQNVKSIGTMNSSVLALFSSGRTRGLVVDVGHEITSAVPVFEGFAIPHATFTTPLAGNAVTNELRNLCKEEDTKTFGLTSADAYEAMKEKVCRVRCFPKYKLKHTKYGHKKCIKLYNFVGLFIFCCIIVLF